jgi:fatty-acyl-CoA synthase
MILSLNTSGSTDQPKKVEHSWDYIKKCALLSAKEIGLTSNDKMLDVFPSNTIAHYTITAYPAILKKTALYSLNFDPYEYIEMFNMIQPSVISLIPRHLEILKRTKNFSKTKMHCVRYMVTGSTKIEKDFIDTFRELGVQTVANWYGMTEMPPPVLIGYNSESFDFTPKEGYVVDFTDEGECVVNNMPTGDIFDLSTKKFIKRKLSPDGKTWKTNI